MPDCPNCGTKVRGEMNFCPKCGASLKAVQPPVEAAAVTVPVSPQPTPAPVRVEKQEKQEKQEKGERAEKYEKEEREERFEKRESSFMGPLVGGIFLMFIGFIFYLIVTATLQWEMVGALFFVLIGLVIIVGAVYAAMMAARRHPRP